MAGNPMNPVAGQVNVPPPVPPDVAAPIANPNLPGAGTTQVSISPVFKLVFLTVLGLTIVCLAVSLYLAMQQQNEATKSLNEKVLTVFNLGCGAIIGLLGGKTIS